MILKTRKKMSFRRIKNINIRRLKLCFSTFFVSVYHYDMKNEDIEMNMVKKKTLYRYIIIPINIRAPNIKYI